MIGKEVPNHIHAILNQPAKPIHSISLPLPLVDTSIVPVILTKPFSFVVRKLSLKPVSVFPCVDSLTVFLTLDELALVFLSVLQVQLTETLLDIVFPCTFVDVTVPVTVGTLVTLIVLETSVENIAVE